ALGVGDPERDRDRGSAAAGGDRHAAELRARREVVARRPAEAEPGHAEDEVGTAAAVRAHEREAVASALVAVWTDLAVVDNLLELCARVARVADLGAGHLAVVRVLRVRVADVRAKRRLADDVIERIPAGAAVARGQRERVRLAGERARL